MLAVGGAIQSDYHAGHSMLISFLRLGCAGLVLASFTTWAMAQSAPAEQAAEMLARAQAVDVKCNYLSMTEKDDLARLVARAELALANRESVEATKAALQRGHEAGATVTCAADEKNALGGILQAAHEADGQQPVAPPPEIKPAPIYAEAQAAIPKPVREVRTAQAKTQAMTQAPVQPLVQKPKVKSKPKPKPKPKRIVTVVGSGGALQNYARLTQAYYVARRCNRQNQGRLYQSVVAVHGQVMQSHSASEVATVLRSAQSRAQGLSCS